MLPAWVSQQDRQWILNSGCKRRSVWSEISGSWFWNLNSFFCGKTCHKPLHYRKYIFLSFLISVRVSVDVYSKQSEVGDDRWLIFPVLHSTHVWNPHFLVAPSSIRETSRCQCRQCSQIALGPEISFTIPRSDPSPAWSAEKWSQGDTFERYVWEYLTCLDVEWCRISMNMV